MTISHSKHRSIRSIIIGAFVAGLIVFFLVNITTSALALGLDDLVDTVKKAAKKLTGKPEPKVDPVPADTKQMPVKNECLNKNPNMPTNTHNTSPPASVPHSAFADFAFGIGVAGSSFNIDQTIIISFAFDPASGVISRLPGSLGDTKIIPGSRVQVVSPPNSRFIHIMTKDRGLRYACIFSFAVESASGALSPVKGAPLMVSKQFAENTAYLVVHPSGNFVYQECYSEGAAVCALRIDPTTGVLSSSPGSPYKLGAEPLLLGNVTGTLAIDSGGRYLYADSKSGVFVYAIDQVTGALSRWSGSPTIPPALRNLGSAARQLQTNVPHILEFSSTENIAFDFGANQAYQVDPSTGSLKQVGEPIDCEKLLFLRPSLVGRFVLCGRSDPIVGAVYVIDAGAEKWPRKLRLVSK